MAEFLLVSLSRYSQNNTQKKKKKNISLFTIGYLEESDTGVVIYRPYIIL